MRAVIFLGLIAIANAVSEPANLENAHFYTAVFIIVALMDLLEFMLKFKEKN